MYERHREQIKASQTMKRHFITFVLTAAAAFLCLACSKDPAYKPGSGSGEGGGDKPTTVTKPDYSGLTAANHPRIILTKEAEASIKAKIESGSDENITLLNKLIINYANTVLGQRDLEYKKVGKRLLDVSTEAANRIIACSYAYRMTGDEKYLTKAEKDINTVCDFSDWNSPTHFLDGAEMAHGVGIGYDWMYSDLSPETRNKAEKAIKNYAFYCALNGKWNLNFYTTASNWNQVCNGGLVIAALAIYETCKTDAQKIIDKALESNAKVMETIYNPDGNYPEGYGYWGYGTAFECIMLSGMESCTGSDNGLSDVAGFKKTGQWIMFMEGMNKKVFNYSDCAPTSVAMPPLWYLAWKFNDPSLVYIESSKIKNGLYSSSGAYKYYPMAIVYADKLGTGKVSAPTGHVWSGNGINPVALAHGDWTFSDSDKFLGVKAGRADYSHGHLDVGSFVYDALGVRWSADLGLQSYSSIENVIAGMGGNFGDYGQNSMRWDVFRYNNFNHSTLTINNARHRVAGRASITQVIDEKASWGCRMDLSDILSDQCDKAYRTVTIENDKDLVVVDEVTAKYNLQAKVRWTMVTTGQPTLEKDRIVLKNGGKTMYLTVKSSGPEVTLKTWSTKGKDYDADNSGYYEVGFEANVTVNKTATFTTTLSPAS